MTETIKPNPAADLQASLRQLRARYDGLSRGDTATLRRCRSADEISVEGTYWRVAGGLARQQVHLSHVVLLFPLAQHRSTETFRFGRFLARQLGDGDGAKLRFRRLLDCMDRDELDHRLRGVLRLACGDSAPVDWGALGTDILWFFAETGTVRRRWAQDFYAPTDPRPEPSSKAIA